MPLANVKKRELKLVIRPPNESTLKDAYADQLTIFKGAKEASSDAITDSLNQGNIAMAQNSELAQIWASGTIDRGSLPEPERQRFDFLLPAYFHVFDSLHYSADVGTGERNLLLAEEKGFSHLMNLPGVREWWDQNPYGLSPEFRSYMDAFRSG